MKTIDEPDIVADADATFLRLHPMLPWRLQSHGRLFGGLVGGGPACGKTTLVRRIVLGAAKAGLQVGLADPIGSSDFRPTGIPTWSALNAITDIVGAANEEITVRQDRRWDRELRAQRRLVVIDHAEQVLDDRTIVRGIERIARCGGKLGVAIILAGTFEGRQTPEGCLQGNTVVLPIHRTGGLGEFGFRFNDQTGNPAHFKDPVTGAVTGFDHWA